MPPEPPARTSVVLVLFAALAVATVNLGALASPCANLPFGRLADPDAYLRLDRVPALRGCDDVTVAIMAPEGLALLLVRTAALELVPPLGSVAGLIRAGHAPAWLRPVPLHGFRRFAPQ